MPGAAKIVQFDDYGGIDVLHLRDAQIPQPGPREVVVEMRAASVNRMDTDRRSGVLQDVLPVELPGTQGCDIAGVVHSVGEGVERWIPGDEVMGWTRAWNAHATHAVVPVDQILPKPPRMAWTLAGSLYMIGATAPALVDACGAAAGETVLVAGASGGVGATVVQLLQERDATVIGVASPASSGWLREIGAVPVTYGSGLKERVCRAAGDRGVSAVIDLAGPEYLDLGVSMGVSPSRLVTASSYERGRELGAAVAGAAEGTSRTRLRHVANLITDGLLRVRVAATYPLERVSEAMDRFEHHHLHGKVVLTNGRMN